MDLFGGRQSCGTLAHMLSARYDMSYRDAFEAARRFRTMCERAGADELFNGDAFTPLGVQVAAEAIRPTRERAWDMPGPVPDEYVRPDSVYARWRQQDRERDARHALDHDVDGAG